MKSEHCELDLSVIVPVYNGAATIEEQLDALLAQDWHGRWEVLIVDNNSTDATPAIAARYADLHPGRVRIVEAPDQQNLSYVRNAGVRHSRARSVAFCDADDIVGVGWLNAMAKALEEHQLVGSRLEYDRLNTMAGSGASRFASEGLASMFGYKVVTGGGSGCQRALWNALGGNNERWDSTGEDFEFSMRASRDFGVAPYFARDAVYHYRLRTNPRAMFRQSRRYGQSHARLYKEFGQPEFRMPARAAVRHSLALLLRIDHLRDPERSLAWSRAAGKRLGRLEGSIRYRTIYL